MLGLGFGSFFFLGVYVYIRILVVWDILWTRDVVAGTAQMREALHVSRKYFTSSGWTRGAIVDMINMRTFHCI